MSSLAEMTFEDEADVAIASAMDWRADHAEYLLGSAFPADAASAEDEAAYRLTALTLRDELGGAAC